VLGEPGACTCSGLMAQMSDHGDRAVDKHDLTDVYVFRKPGAPAKTILVMDVDPEGGYEPTAVSPYPHLPGCS
jgi:hypothetical protein